VAPPCRRQKIMKAKFVKTILDESENRLKFAGIERPDLAAGMLCSSVLGCPRLELALRAREMLSRAQVDKIMEGVSRLEKHEPIQYVLGTTEFMGHVFKCDPRALIPRPETEQLVELVFSHKPLWQTKRTKIIDIGTGTGCIAVSLALLRPKAMIWAIDISPEAIELAKENAGLHGVNSITFLTADLNDLDLSLEMDAVVANPPYVRTADYCRLEKHIRLWEPRTALDGGGDGLEAIRPLISKAFQMLGGNGRLFMEIGFDQWPEVERLLVRTGFRRCALKHDYSGNARMAIAEK